MSERQEWEYACEAWPKAGILERLNAYGREGWELCGMMPAAVPAEVVPYLEPGTGLLRTAQPGPSHVEGFALVFKRPKQSAAVNGRGPPPLVKG